MPPGASLPRSRFLPRGRPTPSIIRAWSLPSLPTTNRCCVRCCARAWRASGRGSPWCTRWPTAGLDALVEQLAGRLGAKGPERLRWIKASVGSSVRLIPVEEILFFQSDEKYTRVVTCDSEALIRKPIKELLDELDPEKFWQVHRATIVNVDFIASVKRGLKDQAELALRDHREVLVVSRAFTHLFKQM